MVPAFIRFLKCFIFNEDISCHPFSFQSAHAAFEIKVFSGSVRRIMYTFNNTETGEPSPPPCIQDYPTAIDTNKYLIKHCPSIPEGLYDVQMSAWNSMDGWLQTLPMQVEVLAVSGPITIDDFQLITDMVNYAYIPSMLYTPSVGI